VIRKSCLLILLIASLVVFASTKLPPTGVWGNVGLEPWPVFGPVDSTEVHISFLRESFGKVFEEELQWMRVMEYDEHGNLSYSVLNDTFFYGFFDYSVDVIEIEYNAAGKIVSLVNRGGSSKVRSPILNEFNFSSESRINFIYDYDGETLLKKEVYNYGPNLDELYTYEYENGKMKEELGYNSEGELSQRKVFEYNSKDELILETTILPSGDRNERRISYEDGQVSLIVETSESETITRMFEGGHIVQETGIREFANGFEYHVYTGGGYWVKTHLVEPSYKKDETLAFPYKSRYRRYYKTDTYGNIIEVLDCAVIDRFGESKEVPIYKLYFTITYRSS